MLAPRAGRAPLARGGSDGGLDCPCFNFDAPEAGCENSTGSGGLLEATGTTSVGLDDLGFAAHGLVSNQAALCFVGTSGLNQGDGVLFGDGKRCAGGSVTRLGVRVPDALGDAAWGPSLAGPGAWSAGDVRFFQVWYRDPGGSPCGGGYNLTNAVAALFAP